jgi:uncharacterized membrane protein YoaK (UPF0700 family)
MRLKLSLPVGFALTKRGLPVLRIMLTIQLILLAAGAGLAIVLSPFPKGDSWPLLATGMTLVCAMAIQNAAARVHLASAPPTTLMTGTTTQIMLDLAELLRGQPDDTARGTRARLKRLSASVAAFALGCALGALMLALVGDWCFLLAPVIGLLAFVTPEIGQEQPA